jgi:hypothetical protein
MASTLPEALDGLYATTSSPTLGPGPVQDEVSGPIPTGWAERALELQRLADAALRAGDWAGFGQRWAELQDLLRRAAGAGGGHQ